MTLNIEPDEPSDIELVLGCLKTLLEKVDRMDRVLSEYEPLLEEVARRMAGPVRFRRK